MKKYLFNCLFVDINGSLKEKQIYNKEKMIDSNINFDGSSINGYYNKNSSDLSLIPDKNAIYNNNFIFCDVNHPADSRKNLKKAISYAKKYGYEINIGAEIEFYLFKKTDTGADLSTNDKKSYMSCCSERIHNFSNLIASHFLKMGINIESIHHEASNNQYELTFKFNNPLIIADQIMIIKQNLKWLCETNENYVSFMPKPFKNQAGSGMHINISISNKGKNIFYENGILSESAHFFANGLMNHIKSISAFACSNINSYKRINAGVECPNKIYMSKNNRNALIRIPDFDKNSARIELRCADICANPYLTFASIIYSGINGIVNHETCKLLNESLPKTLSESLNYLSKDELLNKKMKCAIKNYIDFKNKEILRFNNFVTDFEMDNYF